MTKGWVEHELTANLSSKTWIGFESWIEVIKSQIRLSSGLILCQNPSLNLMRCIGVWGRHRLRVLLSYQYCFKVLLEGSLVEERDECQLLNDEYQKVSWVGRNWQSCYSPFRLELQQLELFGCGWCWHSDLKIEIQGWKCSSSPACLRIVR